MPRKAATKNGSAKNGSGNENFAAALTEVSDRMARLVHDEIELAKAEMSQKASSLARGAAAVAAGAVFGVFAVVFFLLTLAWVLDGIFVSGAGSLWLGFLIVLGILLVLTVGAFLFAWKKLKVGAPTPSLAIDEGKKIKDTVAAFGNGYANGNGNGNGNGHHAATPEAIAAIIRPAVNAAAASSASTAVTSTATATPTTSTIVTPAAVAPVVPVNPAAAAAEAPTQADATEAPAAAPEN